MSVSKSIKKLSGTPSTSFTSSRRVLGSKYLTQSYPTYPNAPPVIGGSCIEGTVATRLFASSASRRGNGSVSSPWPGPVLMTLRGSRSFLLAALPGNRILKYRPAPTKLYRPIVSVVPALSKRNDSLDSDLSQESQHGCHPSPFPTATLSDSPLLYPTPPLPSIYAAVSHSARLGHQHESHLLCGDLQVYARRRQELGGDRGEYRNQVRRIGRLDGCSQYLSNSVERRLNT